MVAKIFKIRDFLKNGTFFKGFLNRKYIMLPKREQQ